MKKRWVVSGGCLQRHNGQFAAGRALLRRQLASRKEKGSAVVNHPGDGRIPADKAFFPDLVARAGRGDEEALTQLLEYCEPKFRIIARVSLGPLLRPQLDTLDLVQSMKRMLIPGLRAGLYELDSPDQLVALAATIIRRKVALYWRRQKKQAVLRLAEQTLGSAEDSLVEHRAQDWENEEFLTRLLESLSDDERQLFRMQLEGLTIVEIAHHLGCRPGPLRARLSRLRKKLRNLAGISWS